MNVKDSKIYLAPLAGYTNLAYRKIMKKAGADVVYSEMISAKGLIYENEQTIDYLNTDDIERPIVMQIFGGEIEDMIKAVQIINERIKKQDHNSGIDMIDINMGCPVRKVIKQGAGSELLKDPEKVYQMVKAVVDTALVPVSCKIRAGIDHEHINCTEIAKAIEKAGASAIAIHGRTRSDLYGGHVNLDYIKSVKEAVSIKVIGNGDIRSIEDAQKMLDYTGCDAIMIGRGALGNPWLITNLATYFNKAIPNDEKKYIIPTLEMRVAMIRHHYEELKLIKPIKIALLEMRSLACFYLKGTPNISKYKLAITTSNDEKSFYQILDNILKENK